MKIEQDIKVGDYVWYPRLDNRLYKVTKNTHSGEPLCILDGNIKKISFDSAGINEYGRRVFLYTEENKTILEDLFLTKFEVLTEQRLRQQQAINTFLKEIEDIGELEPKDHQLVEFLKEKLNEY